MIPTAETVLFDYSINNEIDNLSRESKELIAYKCIEFTRIHCIEQARVISENVEADFEPMGWLTEQHLNTPFIAGEDYEVGVNIHSILNAYSLDLIK